MNLNAALVFAATALAAPILTWIAHLAIEGARNRRAIVILRNEPLAYAGARFDRLLSAAGAPLMGGGRVASMTRKRIECRNDKGSAMVFRPREFVDAYPAWSDPGEGPGLPQRRAGGKR